MIQFKSILIAFTLLWSQLPTEPVKIGAEVLISDGFSVLEGKRVGLITNHTSIINRKHLIDYLYNNDGFDLISLFAPEHGIRGKADAGAIIETETDSNTGLPIFSLHGDTNKPTPEMLNGLDILVFDMQDVGTRFYTYISTMGLAMQASSEAGIEFLVLDRPNPIGGNLVEGFTLEPENKSFIGMYEMPATHGMTIGEIALMLKGVPMLDGLENLELNIIKMEGWTRDMYWPESGLPWIPPSPNIPNFDTAVIYPGACFFGSTSASEGRGTKEPFILIGATWGDGEFLADKLNSYNLPGLYFEPSSFTPRSIDGMSTNPKLLDQQVEGIRYVITDYKAVKPVKAGIYAMHTFFHHAPEGKKPDFFWVQPMLNVSGTSKIYRMIEKGLPPEAIVQAWQQDVIDFEKIRKPYLMYD